MPQMTKAQVACQGIVKDMALLGMLQFFTPNLAGSSPRVEVLQLLGSWSLWQYCVFRDTIASATGAMAYQRIFQPLTGNQRVSLTDPSLLLEPRGDLKHPSLLFGCIKAGT